MSFSKLVKLRYWHPTRQMLQYRTHVTKSHLLDKSIGVVGVGMVGNAVIQNLRKKNFKVGPIYDIDKSKCDKFPDCDIVNSPREVAECSDIIISALPMPVHVKQAFEGDEGLLQGITENKIWIDHSTTDYEQTIRFEELIAEKGGRMLEAPITGGMEALKKGQMTVFLAGDKPLADEMAPLMKTVFSNVQYTGPLGTALIPKVLSNCLSALNMLAATEVLMICKKSAVDLKTAFDCIRASSGNSFLWETGVPMLFQGTYDPSFSVDLHCKDNQLAFELARKHKVPIELLGLVQQIYNRGLYTYGADAPCYIPAKLLEDTLNEPLQCPGFENWSYSIDNVDGSSVIRHHDIDLGSGAQ